MRDNPYKDLPPLERRPDGSLYRMTPAQRKQAASPHSGRARGFSLKLKRFAVSLLRETREALILFRASKTTLLRCAPTFARERFSG